MIKSILLSTLLATSIFALNIPTKHAQEHAFGKSVALNAQIIQLSNAGQSVTSLVNGHLEKYFVEPGQTVKRGDKIALIESIMVSKMTADYIADKKQYEALKKNYEATKKLYDKGMTSMQELNNQSVQKNAMLAQVEALKSQLNTLGIKADKLTEASAYVTLYAHSSGTVSALLKQLHTVVNQNSPIINIVKEESFYVKSFLPLEYASSVKVGQKMVVRYANRDIITHVTQVLPTIDVATQRIVVLSSVDEKVDDLYINTYVASTLYFNTDKTSVAVEKSALSLFNNEWVVFIPREVESDEHKAEEGEEDEESEAVPYEARVVEIIAQDDVFVGVKGLEKDEEYVSDKSYYVKSMLLKSSIGDGD